MKTLSEDGTSGLKMILVLKELQPKTAIFKAHNLNRDKTVKSLSYGSS